MRSQTLAPHAAVRPRRACKRTTLLVSSRAHPRQEHGRPSCRAIRSQPTCLLLQDNAETMQRQWRDNGETMGSWCTSSMRRLLYAPTTAHATYADNMSVLCESSADAAQPRAEHHAYCLHAYCLHAYCLHAGGRGKCARMRPCDEHSMTHTDEGMDARRPGGKGTSRQNPCAHG